MSEESFPTCIHNITLRGAFISTRIFNIIKWLGEVILEGIVLGLMVVAAKKLGII
ncbi:MAG: hypothetical protein WCQ67_04415 [Treponema sp.]